MKPKRLFITGIPTAGKSWAGNLLETELGAVHVEIDDIRAVLQDDPKYQKWVNFYFNQNEKEYLTQTTPEDQWENLIKQSEGLWPALREKIQSYDKDERDVVFEGVNLLPHLMKRDFPDFDGIVMLGPSFEKTFERNKQSPRWGHTEELQRLEVEAFYYGERPRYKAEGEKFGYRVCDTATEAYLIVQDLWK